MPELSFLWPVLLLLVMAVIHLGYYLAHRGRDGQQVIDLRLEPAPRDKSGPPLRLDAEATVVRSGPLPWRPLVKFAEGAEPNAPITVTDQALRIAGGHVREVLICNDDVLIQGRTLVSAPVKVAGDLIIDGEVSFAAPVTVNGYVKVNGHASFLQGLICKSDVVVAGNLVVGEAQTYGWLVTRRLRVEGGLALNGSVKTSEGIDLAEAA